MSNKFFERFAFSLLIFLIPSQLAFHYWPKWSYVLGLRIDLLAPTFYFTDILVLILILLNRKIFSPFYPRLFFAILVASLNILFSTSVPESLYKWIKMFELVFFGLYVSHQNIFSPKEIIHKLVVSASVFSIIGIVQFFTNNTIGGWLYFLGERNFNINTPGIALVNLAGVDHLRAYSTFSHPNSLAGYLGIILLLIVFSNKKLPSGLNLLWLCLNLLCLLLSFSFSAYVSILIVFLVGLVVYKYKHLSNLVYLLFTFSIIVSLLLSVYSSTLLRIEPNVSLNVSQRLDLAHIAGQIFSSHFLTGVGLGNFISNMPLFKGIYVYVWYLQPVHNITLLVLTETGIVGLVTFYFFGFKLLKRLVQNQNTYLLLVFIFVLSTGLTDHYWLTLQQNLLIISLLFGISFV